MSRAKPAGATHDQASVAFGCHPETMRKHFLHLDEMAISDAVFDLIQEGGGSEGKASSADGHPEAATPDQPSTDGSLPTAG